MPKHDGPTQERKPHRPADAVFGDKMEKAYATYLNLAEKVKGLSKHRAIRGEGGEALAAKLNLFIEAMTRDLKGFEVSPEVAVAEPTTPKLDAFIQS